MVMPLWDHSPFKWSTPPYVMWFLIVLNLIVFLGEVSGGPEQMNQAEHIAGVTPAAFTGHSVGGLWLPLTLITYQFLHTNFWHVFLNMIFLFVFGDDIEEVLGHWRFLAFYLLCGIGSALVFVLSSLGSYAPLIGASGAVAGVLSAYLLFRPCARVTCLLGFIPLRLKAYWIICGWAIWQVAEAANRVQDGVAYWGHVGGLITGAAVFIVMRPTGVKLFDCVHSEPVLAAGKFEPLGVMRFVVYIGAAITTLAAITALAWFTMPAAQWRTCAGNPRIDWDTQIGSCTALIQSSQETARNRAFAYNTRGNAYYRKGDFDTALADYNAAIQLDPKYTFAYADRGDAWLAKGDNDRAIADFSEAIRLDPKNAAYLNNRCMARAIAGRELPLAVTDCTEALQIAPNNAIIMDSRGFAYLRLSRLDDAVADYDEALKLNPKQAASLYGRGLAKLKKGDAGGGEADIAAAKAIQADIAEEFARYGVTPSAAIAK
jgi:membrane associated rhomboid family serine protease/Tfp pilus assembly protein PilF